MNSRGTALLELLIACRSFSQEVYRKLLMPLVKPS